MNSEETKRQRLEELLKRQLGPRILSALSDANVTEIIVNDDGELWPESYDQGMTKADLVLSPTQIESIIGTVAASLGTIVNADSPIVRENCPSNASVSREFYHRSHERRALSCGSPRKCCSRSTTTFVTAFSVHRTH